MYITIIKINPLHCRFDHLTKKYQVHVAKMILSS